MRDPSDRSYPPSMPATMQSRKRDATRSIPNPTPMSREASILHEPRHATEQPPEYYDEAIFWEFEYHRVFVDIDVFMEHVLHVLENWRELWRRTIMRIKHDETFLISCWDYRRECEIQSFSRCVSRIPLTGVENGDLHRPIAISQVLTTPDELLVTAIPSFANKLTDSMGAGAGSTDLS